MRKQALIKVYTPDGTFLKLWQNAIFKGFVKELNAGLSECIIELQEKFDYQGAELKLGNIVDITISDKENQNLLIYSGYISMYAPRVLLGLEKIEVTLLGHYTKLATDILKDTNTTTFYTDITTGLTTTSPGSSADIGLVIRAILDRYRAETTNPRINYTPNSIPLVSENALCIFEMKTYQDALDIMMSIISSGYNWYVDEYGTFYLKIKPTVPTHTFIFKKHFQSVIVEKSMEKIRNALLFWNGEIGAPQEIYKLYKNDASILQHGRRIEKYFDYSIGNEATADKIGARFLMENKEPNVKVVCEITDNNEDDINGYDIEDIQPGDTCQFKGFDEQFADIFRENMLITKVVYSLDKVELTVEIVKSGLLDWLDRIDKGQWDYKEIDAPPIYT